MLVLIEELVAGDQWMVPQTPPDGDTEQEPVSEQTMMLQNRAAPQLASDRDSRLRSCTKHGVNTGRDLPRAAAVTRGHGERLLGVMLVGNAILRLREEREQSQYVRIQTHNSATRHHHTHRHHITGQHSASTSLQTLTFTAVIIL